MIMKRSAISDELLCDVTLAVLAGDEGRRMGGAKTALKLNAQPILAYLLDRLAWRGPTLPLTTTGRENPTGHEMFDVEAIDAVAGQRPVRRILTTLLNSKTPIVVVVPVDMPTLEHESVSWFEKQLLGQPEANGVMTYSGIELQPFPAALRRTVASVIQTRLEKGLRSVKGLADEDECSSWPRPVRGLTLFGRI